MPPYAACYAAAIAYADAADIISLMLLMPLPLIAATYDNYLRFTYHDIFFDALLRYAFSSLLSLRRRCCLLLRRLRR